MAGLSPAELAACEPYIKALVAKAPPLPQRVVDLLRAQNFPATADRKESA